MTVSPGQHHHYYSRTQVGKPEAPRMRSGRATEPGSQVKLRTRIEAADWTARGRPPLGSLPAAAHAPVLPPGRGRGGASEDPQKERGA